MAGLEWAERRSARVVALAVGDAIRTLSGAAGLTQKTLGEAVGASQGNISDWMRGERLPPLTKILDIEDACEKPHGTLLRLAGLLEAEALRATPPLQVHPPHASAVAPLLRRAEDKLSLAKAEQDEAEYSVHQIQSELGAHADDPFPDAEDTLIEAEQWRARARRAREYYESRVAWLADPDRGGVQPDHQPTPAPDWRKEIRAAVREELEAIRFPLSAAADAAAYARRAVVERPDEPLRIAVVGDDYVIRQGGEEAALADMEPGATETVAAIFGALKEGRQLPEEELHELAKGLTPAGLKQLTEAGKELVHIADLWEHMEKIAENED